MILSNTTSSEPNDFKFADDTFKCIFEGIFMYFVSISTEICP